MKETIRRIAIFKGLDDKTLRTVASTAITCSFASGETIVREGEPGIGMYFVLRGRVAIIRNQPGPERRLGEVGPDGFFAEMALIDEQPRVESAISLEQTECLLFTRDTFLKLVEKHPSLSLRLARVLAERLRAALEHQAPQAAAAIGEPASAASGGPAESGLKAEIQKKLIQTFEALYTAKAMTRFAVAVLGCPVEGFGPDALEVIRIGDVKAVILPAEGSSRLSIEAFGSGQFQLHVFHPDQFLAGAAGVLKFEPVVIEPRDLFELSLPNAVLTQVGPALGESRS